MASPEVLGALTDAEIITLASNEPTEEPSESSPQAGPTAAPSVGLEIFGRSLFERETGEFSPDLMGPVDPDYRLGPGDELWLVLTGDVEAIHKLSVNREGMVFIPDVGQVAVNGLTLGQLEDRLYDRLGRVYSGVRRGPDATTRFQVSLGRLRVNQVYVIGEVERPSAYQVSAASTVLDALYQAGGPSLNGSFRAIDVYRGGTRVATVDLYEYLLQGRSTGEIRLEHGDRIFVRPYTRRVTVRGAVRRPAIYELLEGEDLRTAIAFAGGLDATAVVERVQIDRILPPEMRRPGIERVLIDVPLSQVMDPGAAPVELRDGDVVEVFTVADERRHRVVVTGAVHRPGTYEWSEGLTLHQLMDKALGLTEEAYTARAHVSRLVTEDGSRRVIQVPLAGDSTGAPWRVFLLADRDSIVIYSRAQLRNERFVSIDGFVKHPGHYPLAEGMTVRDLILAAGASRKGPTHGSRRSRGFRTRRSVDDGRDLPGAAGRDRGGRHGSGQSRLAQWGGSGRHSVVDSRSVGTAAAAGRPGLHPQGGRIRHAADGEGHGRGLHPGHVRAGDAWGTDRRRPAAGGRPDGRGVSSGRPALPETTNWWLRTSWRRCRTNGAGIT